MDQISMYEMLYPTFKIDKPIRLIELFAGYGSQALALKYLGVPFESWKTCEWAIKSIQAYKDIHHHGEHIEVNMTKEEMYVADSVNELAGKYGVATGSVYSMISRGTGGYYRVEVEDDN